MKNAFNSFLILWLAIIIFENRAKAEDGPAPGEETATLEMAKIKSAPEEIAKVRMEKHSKAWVDGNGFDVKFGDSYEKCAKRCIEMRACVMLEYYLPKKKCNIYSKQHRIEKDGDGFVAVKVNR